MFSLFTDSVLACTLFIMENETQIRKLLLLLDLIYVPVTYSKFSKRGWIVNEK